jgi:hypothetical protein
MMPASTIWVTKASSRPPALWIGVAVGKAAESVAPVT